MLYFWIHLFKKKNNVVLEVDEFWKIVDNCNTAKHYIQFLHSADDTQVFMHKSI